MIRDSHKRVQQFLRECIASAPPHALQIAMKLASDRGIYDVRNWTMTKHGYTLSKDFEESRKVKFEETPWAYTFNGVRRALSHLRSPVAIVQGYFTTLQIPELPELITMLFLPAQWVDKKLSELTSYIHMNIDKFNITFTLFIGLNSMNGYPHIDDRRMDDSARDWLTNPVVDMHPSSWWKHQFLDTYYQNNKLPKVQVLTFAQFVSSPWLWVTDGSSSASELVVDGKPLRTKFAAGVSRTPEELLKLVDDALTAKTDIKVFIKPDEKGMKRRLIANPSLGGYLLASYVRYLLQVNLGEAPSFMTASTDFVIDTEIIELLRAGRRSMPLDESKYDYHISKNVWIGFLDCLDTLFPNNVGVTCFRRYVENTSWKFEDEIGPWLKGMPSGLALTSLLNTWVNFIKQRAISSPVHLALGDDVLLFPDLPVTIEQVSNYYSSFGAEVNKNKNWTSTKYGEFLRYIYSTQGRIGYPARVYSSLIWGLDVRSDSTTSKLNELAELWKQLFDRALLHMNERLVAADLSRALSRRVAGFSASRAAMWLHSPRIHGGFGKLPYNNVSFEWIATESHLSVVKGNKVRIPRAMNIDKAELKVGTYVLNGGTSLSVGEPYRLPPINSVEDWERRLNFEDMPNVPLKSLSLGVIPLPVIDFVSTSAMSNFASMYHAYAYPGLRGSINAIASRMIRTSLWLVSNVVQLMAVNNIQYYC